MSSLTYPAVNDPEPSGSSDIPLWIVLVAIAVMLAGGGLVGYVILDQAREHAAGPSYPDTWDPRVAPFAKIAEKERGLAFRHPVSVRFLPADEFEKTVRSDELRMEKEDRERLEQAEEMLRALRLLDGKVDLVDALGDAYGSGTLAYYSFDDERVTVRGVKVTPAMRSTLVHELTHALQDQHFDIGERVEELRKVERDDRDTTTESSVLHAIVEGDARRVETLYRESLPPKRRKALERSSSDESDAATGKLKNVPKIVLTMISSPYVLGEALTMTAAEDGGNAAVDALLGNPPEHDAVLLDPFRILTGATEARNVETPKLHAGEKKFDSGEFGAVTWFFMLAQRMPVADALDTVDGWGGDAYVAFQRNGTSCVRAAYVGKTGDDTVRMLGALERWSAGASTATVSPDGRRVMFESCDPGRKTEVGKDSSEDALEVAGFRSGVAIGVMRGGAPPKVAQCIAKRIVHEYSVSQLTAPSFDGRDPSFRANVQRFAAACR